MKAVQVMFDTLSRRFLSIYGNEWVQTPNFERLAEKAVVYNKFFAGSLPCIPARRELHTGRYNFLHRSWGPLEPYDFSVIETLKNNGIYTHLVTDHSHYFEDGGATYHNRFNTWEGFRGQEGDRWVPTLNPKSIFVPKQSETNKKGPSLLHNYANRTRQNTEEEMSSVMTIRAGVDFLEKYHDIDQWFLQIECFDPHEPFFVPQKYLDMYQDTYTGDVFDWPPYSPITSESDEQKEHIVKRYAALITMCDTYLGEILDQFDRYNLWQDTMLIINTDHGFLLGEHDWYGKNVQPNYNEIAHLPFLIYKPNSDQRESNTLVRTIDIAPTLLDYFNQDIPDVVQGKSISNESVIDNALFGVFGAQVNITDGHHVYMRGPNTIDNQPLFEYTMMPTRMRGFIETKALQKAVLQEPFSFTNGMPQFKIPSKAWFSPYRYGHKLFDIDQDYEQKHPIDNLDLEIEWLNKLRDALIASDAPIEQYERLGLSIKEDMTKDKLLKQRLFREAYQKIDIGLKLNSKQEAKIRMIREMLPKPVYEQWITSLVQEANENSNIETVLEKSIVQVFEMMKLPSHYASMLMSMLEYADKDS